MSHPAITDGVSPAIAEALQELFMSGDSQAYAVADCLNDIASNGDEKATDEFLVTCAEEIIAAADRVIQAVNLRELSTQPTPINGIDETGQVVIYLANGYELRSGWRDTDDPDRLPAGDYVSIIDTQGQQVFYGDSADLFSDPVQSRRSLCSIIQVCCGARVRSTLPDQC